MLPSCHSVSLFIPSPILFNNSFIPSPLLNPPQPVVELGNKIAFWMFLFSWWKSECCWVMMSDTMPLLLWLWVTFAKARPHFVLDPIPSQCCKDSSLAILPLSPASPPFSWSVVITYKHILVSFIKSKNKNLLIPPLSLYCSIFSLPLGNTTSQKSCLYSLYFSLPLLSRSKLITVSLCKHQNCSSYGGPRTSTWANPSVNSHSLSCL